MALAGFVKGHVDSLLAFTVQSIIYRSHIDNFNVVYSAWYLSEESLGNMTDTRNVNVVLGWFKIMTYRSHRDNFIVIYSAWDSLDESLGNMTNIIDVNLVLEWFCLQVIEDDMIFKSSLYSVVS